MAYYIDKDGKLKQLLNVTGVDIIGEDIKDVDELPTATAETVGILYRCGGVIYEGIKKTVYGDYIDTPTSGNIETDLNPLPCRYIDINTLTEKLTALGSVEIITVNYDGTNTETITASAAGVSTSGDTGSSQQYTLEDWINGGINLYEYYSGYGYNSATYTLTDVGISLLAGQTINNEYVISPLVTKDTAEQPYKLIEKITLTEATTQITRTAEIDGTEYQFEKLFFKFSFPQVSTTCALRLMINNAFMAQLGNALGANYATCSVGELTYIEDRKCHKWETTQNTNSFGNTVNVQRGYFFNQQPIIKKIDLYSSNDSVDLPAGSVIEIYGVRVNED